MPAASWRSRRGCELRPAPRDRVHPLTDYLRAHGATPVDRDDLMRRIRLEDHETGLHVTAAPLPQTLLSGILWLSLIG